MDKFFNTFIPVVVESDEHSSKNLLIGFRNINDNQLYNMDQVAQFLRNDLVMW